MGNEESEGKMTYGKFYFFALRIHPITSSEEEEVGNEESEGKMTYGKFYFFAQCISLQLAKDYSL